MKGIVVILLLALCAHCSKDSAGEECHTAEGGVTATVKDLSGLDGCGLVFEMSDGSVLIPERRTYIQAPSQQDDPIYYFELIPGQRVSLRYIESSAAGVCMSGKIVFVTCIKSLS